VMASPQIGLNRLTNAERFHPNAKVNPFLQEYPCQPVPDDATSTVALDSVDVLPHEHKEDAPMRHSTSLIAKRLISTSVLTAAAVLALPAINDDQYVEHWRHEGPGKVAGGEYFKHNSLTGLVYNPVTDNVLVAARHLHVVPNASQVLV